MPMKGSPSELVDARAGQSKRVGRCICEAV